jgi:Zn-dependent protease
MDVSPDQVRTAILSLVAFLVSVAVHEFGHAFVADRLGDRTPRSQGRVTLSPLAHADLIGTIILPLLAAFNPGMPMLAWGKPVQTNPGNYSRRLPWRVGHMLVAVAGPAMNFLLALVMSGVIVGLGMAHAIQLPLAAALVRYVVYLNIVLMFFNLIPLPPLDGANVLAGFLPARLQIVPQTLRRYGTLLFLVLYLSGVLSFVMRPAFHVANVWAEAVLRKVAAAA